MKKTLLPLALFALSNLTAFSIHGAMACDAKDYRPPRPIAILEIKSDTNICLAQGISFRIISIDGKFFIDTPKINSDEDIQMTLEEGTWIIAEKKWLQDVSI